MAQQAQDGIQSNAIHEVVDTKKKGRVIFASQLRAIAFLSVVAVHWLGIYSLNPTFISSVTGAPDVSTGNSAYYISILPPLPYFNYGPFGVSIFFIISGFVLTYSMRNKSPLGYLFARIIRIYPTYIVCSLIMLAVFTASNIFWGSANSISMDRFIYNITLLASIFNYGSIDYVNWTLSIEIKFYITCLLVYGAIRSANIIKLLCIQISVFAITFFTANLGLGSSQQGFFSFDALKIEFMYISYMTLGILLNFYFEKRINTGEFIASTMMTAILVGMTWKCGPQSNQFIEVGVNYIYGYIVFLIAMLLNDYFKEVRPLSFLANISYSFYALHSVIGYCIIRFLTGSGFSYLVSLIAAFSIVTTLAYLMHITIEKKSINIGRTLK